MIRVQSIAAKLVDLPKKGAVNNWKCRFETQVSPRFACSRAKDKKQLLDLVGGGLVFTCCLSPGELLPIQSARQFLIKSVLAKHSHRILITVSLK